VIAKTAKTENVIAKTVNVIRTENANANAVSNISTPLTPSPPSRRVFGIYY